MFINKLKRLHMEMNVDRQPTDFKYSCPDKISGRPRSPGSGFVGANLNIELSMKSLRSAHGV